MHYNAKIYEKAENEIKRRNEEAMETYERRVSEIRKRAPEIAKLCISLSQTSVKLTEAIINGGNNTAKLIEEIKNNNLQTQEKIRTYLREFGFGEDYLEIPYTCKKCKDTGSVMGDMCDCFKELLKKLSVDELNSNSKITLHDFSEFRIDYYPETGMGDFSPRKQMQAVYDFCVEYVESFNEHSASLLFKGKTGLGKTFISSAIAKNLIERGFSVVFDSVQNIIRSIENEHFGRSEGNTMEVVSQADLVILDDLGSEFVSGFTSSVIYNLLNDRINLQKPVIISTNFSNAELDKIYNERIISRISSFFPIQFEGKDIRQIILKNQSGN